MRRRICFFLWFTFLLILSSCSFQAEAYPPVEGKIVFKSKRGGKEGIYLYEKGKLKFLSSKYYPAWFRDGKRILVANTTPEVTVLDLNGRTLDTVDTGIDTFKPDLLPDESGFVFIGTERNQAPDGKVLSEIDNLYLYRFSDKTVTNVTSITEQGHIQSFGASPANDWVAVSWFGKTPKEAIDPKTYVVIKPELEKDEAYLLSLKTKEKIFIGNRIGHLQWSSDGKRLFYEMKKPAKTAEELKAGGALFSYDPETKTSTLVHEPFSSMGFRFSPDGKKILFENWCAHGICLFVLDLETKETHHLLKTKIGQIVNDQYPDWHA